MNAQDQREWEAFRLKVAGAVHAVRHLNNALEVLEMLTDQHGFTPGVISMQLIEIGHPIAPEGTSLC